MTYRKSAPFGEFRLWAEREFEAVEAGIERLLPVRILAGTGSPESAVIGRVGDLYLRKDGGAGTTLYVKESGDATNTGWVGK